MAKALVEVVGDSASAVRALEQTSAALTATGDAAKNAAVDMDAYAASAARAGATRAETLLGQSAALKQFSAANVGTTEGAVAQEAALKRQTQAYRLLGVQAATTGKSLTETAGTIGRGLTTYVTAPTAFIGYEAVKNAIDFNQQMLLLKTQAGDATDSIKTLSNEVLKLSSSGAPQGPVQLSEGLFHLVSLGLRGAQAMGTLREASLAAGMGMANLEDTSTALGAAVVSGIRGAQNYSQAMATLVGTAGAGNMRFQDLASSIGNVIPSAAAAGITLHEMGAALAVLTDRGMSAEEAATRLRMSLALIQRPSKAAQAALADMGVNADDLGAMIRQPNGLLKVLEVLHTAMDKVGTVRGNRDLLEAFGGARSGIGIQTLVQSLDSSVSSYQGKLQQINQDQAQFATNQQQYLESPAYKLHTALAQVEADLVKLGTALTPAVTGMATTVSGLANAFSALPGPIKESIGGIVVLLAAGGPLGLAISGVRKLIGGLGVMFGRLVPESTTALTTMGAEADAAAGQVQLLVVEEGRIGPVAIASGAQADAALTSVGGSATAATAEVGALRTSLLGVAAAAGAAYAIIKTVHWAGEGITHSMNLASGSGVTGTGQGRGNGDPTNPSTWSSWAKAAWIVQHGGSHNAQWWANNPAAADAFLKVHWHPTPAARAAHDATHPGHPDRPASPRHSRTPGIHDLHTSAPTVLGSTAAAAAAAAKKKQTLFDQAVHNDTLLAQARIDLAKGEYSAAQDLLRKDQARLQLMLSEARTATERADVLRQLATVERMRHSKADQFALSPEMQAEIAKADAEAVLNPQGMIREQVRLAEQAKAQAMRAIRSHQLTMQGLTAAWQIVQQENSVIAGALGLANSYHVESSAAIVGAVKGLNEAQRMQLRERIAQAEAHRGYVPNAPGSQTHRHVVDVHVHSNDSHIVKVVKKHDRNAQQRAGGRR